MKLKTILAAALCGCLLTGCVSELTQREYAAWQKSENANASVNVFQFELYYMNGWRERVRTEYQAWQKSDDGVAGVSLDQFRDKYMSGWKERAQKKHVAKLLQAEYKAWQKSADSVKGVSYEEFATKYRKAWRAKVAKKRAAARQKAIADELRRKRGERIAEIASADLKAIRKNYAYGNTYVCPFPRYDEEKKVLSDWQKPDWMKTWTEPRLDLSEEDKLAGEALLSEFGTKYLPNAYANYEKKKDAAAELQQVFNEEFPEPRKIGKTDPKWNALNKVLEKFAKVRTEYFKCHDELCHYWLMWRLGVMSEKELAEADTQPLAVAFLPENVSCAGYTLTKAEPMDEKVADFAARYAPESAAIYQKLDREFKELDALLSEVFKQRQQMDDVRFSRVLTVAVAKRSEIVRQMNALSQNLQAWHMDHRTTEKTSEDVAKCDHAMVLQLKPFVESLPSYIKDKGCGRVIPASDMIAVPSGKFVMTKDDKKSAVSAFRLQRTEVTQLQWMMVMGTNPSQFKGLGRPVENVSWDDCQEFIKYVSAMDGVQYRLPTEAEWKYACRAGSTGDWGSRKNGEEGPLDVMGWYDGNSNEGTHSVAQKEPNAWGLYDMHGNVAEWCADLNWPGGSDRVYRGGSWYDRAGYCTAGDRNCNYPGHRNGHLGFRLAAPLD